MVCAPFGRSLVPIQHNGLDRGLPPYATFHRLMHPTVWPEYTNVKWRKTDRQLRQDNPPIDRANQFWATICKTVRPMLSDRCLSVLSVCLSVCSVCDVGVLWPNGCMDQYQTWHAGRPRPWPHCVRWGPSSLSPKREEPPNFRFISVVAKWLDGSRCHLVDLGPGDIVLDGNPAPPSSKGHSPTFLANVSCGQTAGWLRCHLLRMLATVRS